MAETTKASMRSDALLGSAHETGLDLVGELLETVCE
jgi:hypothetical protein